MKGGEALKGFVVEGGRINKNDRQRKVLLVLHLCHTSTQRYIHASANVKQGEKGTLLHARREGLGRTWT